MESTKALGTTFCSTNACTRHNEFLQLNECRASHVEPDKQNLHRAGVDKNRRIKAPTRQRRWQPLRDLAGLEARSKTVEQSMGPLVDVPALVRIEDEKWVFERIDEDVLHQLTHRLVLHEEEGTRTIGATINLASAMQVAKCMAEQEQKIVLIRPM